MIYSPWGCKESDTTKRLTFSLPSATRYAYIYNLLFGVCTAIIIYSAINSSLSITHTPTHTYFHFCIYTPQSFNHRLNQKV